MTRDPIKSTEGLKVGTVLMVAKKITSRNGGDDYWWRTFRVVTWVDKPSTAMGIRRTTKLMILKLHVDPDKDEEYVDVLDSRYVLTVVDEAAMPQGVSAMLMKLIHTGVIKLGED